MTEKKIGTTGNKDIDENKILGAISYLWLISVVTLLLKKDSEFVQFHAKQGLILFILSVILWFIPFIGWILNLVIFVIIVIGFIKALQGEKWEIPLISMITKKIKL